METVSEDYYNYALISDYVIVWYLEERGYTRSEKIGTKRLI